MRHGVEALFLLRWFDTRLAIYSVSELSVTRPGDPKRAKYSWQERSLCLRKKKKSPSECWGKKKKMDRSHWFALFKTNKRASVLPKQQAGLIHVLSCQVVKRLHLSHGNETWDLCWVHNSHSSNLTLCTHCHTHATCCSLPCTDTQAHTHTVQ